MDYSQEAMRVLAEYVKAFDKCANEPDETYGEVFIATESTRERLKQFFTTLEFNAIIVNLGEIREVLNAVVWEPPRHGRRLSKNS